MKIRLIIVSAVTSLAFASVAAAAPPVQQVGISAAGLADLATWTAPVFNTSTIKSFNYGKTQAVAPPIQHAAKFAPWCVNKLTGVLRAVKAAQACHANEVRVLHTFVLPPGPAGATGAAGAQGPKGNDGSNGTNGLAGAAGTNGAAGANGAAGETGASGAQGETGAPGSSGILAYQVFQTVQSFGPGGIGGAWCGAPDGSGFGSNGWVVVGGGAQLTDAQINAGVAVASSWPNLADPANPGWNVQVNKPADAGVGDVTVYAVCLKVATP